MANAWLGVRVTTNPATAAPAATTVPPPIKASVLRLETIGCLLNYFVLISFAQIEFETRRLGIRSCKLSDADTLSGLMKAQISQWVAHWSFPLSPQQAQVHIASYLELASTGLASPAIICEKQTGQIIGWHMLQLR